MPCLNVDVFKYTSRKIFSHIIQHFRRDVKLFGNFARKICNMKIIHIIRLLLENVNTFPKILTYEFYENVH